MRVLLKFAAIGLAAIGTVIALRTFIAKISGQPGEFGSGSYDTWPPVQPATGKRV
ncbi:MAG: hypothetical protein M1399_01170 [Actinobacteria bacterium]|nr:hypothetical protein [Actinomycetota bacterium]MCL5446782.1 hypothetical protein [Actinomycetota bacterium]